MTDYEGWTESELLTRRDELEDEIEALEAARAFEYLIEEGFITVEEHDGEYFVYPEASATHIQVPEPA